MLMPFTLQTPLVQWVIDILGGVNVIPGRVRLAYLGNGVYPRGFRGGTARSAHFFSPHFEHRIRFATSSSRASQPHNRASVRGSAVLSCPHAPHFIAKVY
jgi:hypothetical protein